MHRGFWLVTILTGTDYQTVLCKGNIGKILVQIRADQIVRSGSSGKFVVINTLELTADEYEATKGIYPNA